MTFQTVSKIRGQMCPGQISSSEEFSYEGIDGISISIKQWLNHLWEEIIAAPENRIFIAQKEDIEKIKERVSGIPDEYFTIDEAKDIKERLAKIEAQLAEQLISEAPNQDEANKQIEKLHQEIEILKQTIHSIKKSGWFKSFITKTMTWLSDPNNQKLLKAGKDMVTKMLPEGGN